MRYLSVCSGIEAASVAWHDFGWEAVGFAEIDKGPSRVLAHHYGSNLPGDELARNGVPNFGDFTEIPLDTLGTVDLLVGGTPCQAFSVAGKRLSLDDARGNLTLAYVVLAHELARSHGLRTALWENVPGVLSTKDNAFGCFLGALVGSDAPLDLPKGIERWPDAGMAAGPRARLAWRVLDAQYFGLAQRRRRVFVVASFGDGGDPAAVLFERAGVRRHPPARGEARQNLAPTISARTRGGGGLGTDAELDRALIAADAPQPLAFGGGNCSGPIDKAACLTAKGQRIDFEVETFIAGSLTASRSSTQCPNEDTTLIPVCVTGDVAHTLRAEGFDASEDGTGRGQPIVAHAFDARQSDVIQYGDMTGPLDTDGHTIGVSYAIQAGALRENPASGPDGVGVQADHAYTLEARAEVQAVAFAQNSRDEVRFQGGDGQIVGALAAEPGMKQTTYVASYSSATEFLPQSSRVYAEADAAPTLQAAGTRNGNRTPQIQAGMAVRRLTPRECERLQGFPDDHTLILKSDGPRYKALGNSMAVSVMRWIGERIKSAAEAR